MYIMDTIFNDFKNIIGTIVIKYEKKGKALDTIEITKASDRYVSAMLMEDTFNTYQNFDLEAIESAGVLDIDLARQYAQDKYSIPMSLRDAIVINQRNIIIRDYVEQNNYYRMLNGKPNIDDFDYVYIDLDTCQKYSIDPSIPIHELPNDDIIKLTNVGIVAKIQNDNPTKKYLNFLGNLSIDIVTARIARNFGILYMTKDMSESFYEEFNKVYEQCREYFMSVLYIKEYGSQYDLYDNFIALMIMIMTIQRIITNTFKYGIERDFYDLGSIQMMFDAYNVPFISSLPIDYQRIILRNLNNLLRYKSTDKVLYDICSLLGFNRINIYKYYLVKDHKLDDQEKPIFAYKDDGNGNMIPDVQQMYEFYYQTVELRERNVALALHDSLNKQSFEQVTVDDPYWWSDDNLMNLLYNTEFNYVETKYVNMNIMYKMTEMLFEIMYVFRMLLDKKDDFAKIDLKVDLPKLFERRSFALFDVVVFLCALLAKKNSLAGNILTTPSKVLSVMGFNFKSDFKAIRDEIQSNPKIYDQELLQYFQKSSIEKPDDINSMYVNIKGFNDFIVEKMAQCQDLTVYKAYEKLYKALMVTDETSALFVKSDGYIAETYLDYLYDANMDLYNFVVNADKDSISEYIDHILSKINELAASLKYLFIINDSNNVLLNAVITLTRFFKSYTVDLTSFNILYLMDSRYYNMIKIIEKINYMSKELSINDDLIRSYADTIRFQTKIKNKDTLPIRDALKIIRS